jgi:KipI family sensor histidine kinase inhibitor
VIDSPYEMPRFHMMGDRSLIVEVGAAIGVRVNRAVHELCLLLNDATLPGVLDMVPCNRSLMVVFDPGHTGPSRIQEQVLNAWRSRDTVALPEPRTMKIPVMYGGPFGPDLEAVAAIHQSTPERIVAAHTGIVFQVFMIGFMPGFPYMGELPENLSTPRRETPRTRVPRGSVGIAQRQTGIYPAESPGGWQIIGRTPLVLFNAANDPPALLAPGDRVQFYAVAAPEADPWPA